MIVPVDMDKMFKLGITPSEYVLLHLIQNRALTSARKLVSKTPELTYSTLEKLVEKRLIHNSNNTGEVDISKIFVRNSFISEIKKDNFFDELLSVFPGRVTRPDGTVDYLKTDLNRSRKLYTSMIKGDEVTHREIMGCLRLELQTRERTNAMRYIKRLPNWLSAEDWKIWKQIRDENNTEQENELGYGLKLE